MKRFSILLMLLSVPALAQVDVGTNPAYHENLVIGTGGAKIDKEGDADFFSVSIQGTPVTTGLPVMGLNDLTDVTLTSPVSDSYLSYNGSAWVNAVHSLNSLSNVVVPTPTTNDVLYYNGTNWVNSGPTMRVGRDDLDAGNLNIYGGTGASKASFSIWNAAGEDSVTERFYITPQATGNALEFFADAVELMQIARNGSQGQLTVYEAVSNGQPIFANGAVVDAALSAQVAHLNAAETITANWVNTASPWADNEVTDDLTIASTNKITAPASNTTRASINMAHGSAPTAPVDGDVWTTTSGMFGRISGVTVGPYAAASGPSALNDLSNVVVPTPATNDVLYYNGTNWVNSGPTLGIGQDDVDNGQIDLYGGTGASKASIDIWNAAGEDGVTERFIITPQATGNALEFFADAVELMQIARNGSQGQLTVYEAVSNGQPIFANGAVVDAALSAQVAHLNAAETITANWVNTAVPWADNEVTDDLTINTDTLIQGDDLTLSGVFQYDETNPTISSGSISVTSGFMSVSAQSAGVDDLDTITAAASSGQIIRLTATFGHTITVREVGNIQLAASTRVLTVGDTLVLRSQSTVWCEETYSNNN